jgi:hypothetical protein
MTLLETHFPQITQTHKEFENKSNFDKLPLRQENNLSLNKTKELIMDFRRQQKEHTPILIDRMC